MARRMASSIKSESRQVWCRFLHELALNWRMHELVRTGEVSPQGLGRGQGLHQPSCPLAEVFLFFGLGGKYTGVSTGLTYAEGISQGIPEIVK